LRSSMGAPHCSIEDGPYSTEVGEG
jgi:hypothetical protein